MNGNSGADVLAVAAASMQQFLAEAVRSANERKDVAVQVQQIMLAILKARILAEGCSPSDAGDDRGSDMSDCMEDEFIDDESDSAGAILCDAEQFVSEFLRSGAPRAQLSNSEGIYIYIYIGWEYMDAMALKFDS